MIEKSTRGERIDTLTENPKTVTLFDAMAVVKLGPAIKNCHDFATASLHIILAEGKEADEIRIAFDRYVRDSLKLSTRQKRNASTPVRYEVSDSTSLVNSTLKKFLPEIQTKQDLTIYLGKFLHSSLKDLGVKHVISCATRTVSNIPVGPELDNNNHEEADTLLVLRSLDVARQDPFRKLEVVSPDTVVFLLLTHYFPNLPQQTKFVTGRGNDRRSIDVAETYEALGPDKSDAVLGFHTFTGCDQTSKFTGKSKLTCWKVFESSSSSVLKAFKQLGVSEGEVDPSVTLVTLVTRGLQVFVVQLYMGQSIIEEMSLAEARLVLYIKL